MDAPINDDCAENSEQTTKVGSPTADVDFLATNECGPAPSTIPRPPSPARRSALDGSKSRSERKQSTSRLTPKQKEAHRKRLYRGANISMQVVDILLKSRTGIVEFLHDKNLRLFRQTVSHEGLDNLPKYAREIDHGFYARKAILEAVRVRWDVFLESKDNNSEFQTFDECVPSELIFAGFYDN